MKIVSIFLSLICFLNGRIIVHEGNTNNQNNYIIDSNNKVVTNYTEQKGNILSIILLNPFNNIEDGYYRNISNKNKRLSQYS